MLKCFHQQVLSTNDLKVADNGDKKQELLV